MITPPFATPSFYTVLFEEPGAQFLTALMAPKFAKNIHQLLITSKDLTSDIEATIEMKAAAELLVQKTGFTEVDTEGTFNPIYMPMSTENMLNSVEINNEGEISSVNGFTNPFVSFAMTLSMPDHPEFVDGKTSYKEFQLPGMEDMLSTSNGLYLS